MEQVCAAKQVLNIFLAITAMVFMLYAGVFLFSITMWIIPLLPWIYSKEIKDFFKSLFKL